MIEDALEVYEEIILFIHFNYEMCVWVFDSVFSVHLLLLLCSKICCGIMVWAKKYLSSISYAEFMKNMFFIFTCLSSSIFLNIYIYKRTFGYYSVISWSAVWEKCERQRSHRSQNQNSWVLAVNTDLCKPNV